MDFDLLVIGGGPGGYVAAIRAAQLGAKTALVEKAELGGTCLNRGCIPTKALLAATEKIEEIHAAEKFGISVSGLSVDFPKMVKRKNAVVAQLQSGVSYLLRHHGVAVLQGFASFVNKNTVEVSQGEKKQTITAKKIIVATGSVPRKLQLSGNTACTMTSDDILNIQDIPSNLVIIGGGIIGIEFATIFNNLGSKVTIVEILDRILPQMDSEIVNVLSTKLKQKGIEVITGSRVEEIEQTADQNYVVIAIGDGSVKRILADKILVAPGRVACLEGLNLEAAGVKYNQKGIQVSENLLTSVDHIYAIGDATGGIQLAHLASAQGMYAAEHAMGKKPYICLDYVPFCIYTSPEVASVGQTEEQLKEQGMDYKVARYSLNSHGKAVAAGCNEGLMKLLYEPKYGQILGLHIIAPRATDIVGEAVLAMRAELTVGELATTIHAHPTLAEALMEAAHIAHGTPIHTV